MGESTNIEWCDHSFNPWIGCSKISPACDNCYAEVWARRTGQPELWQGARRKTSLKNWSLPVKWNRLAGAAGERKRVFCASLADVFDNEVSDGWRADLWSLIRDTPNLDWLLLSKRIGNARTMLPRNWDTGYANVWLGSTVVNQEEAERDVPKLIAIPAVVRFLSVEPMLGPITLFDDNEGVLRGPGVVRSGYTQRGNPADPPEDVDDSYSGIDWVICGGESSSKARSMPPEWAISLLYQCKLSGTQFFMKQMSQADTPAFKNFSCFPPDLQIREFPR